MPLLPGSIAFVGFNADGNDNLAFVALTDIAAGETLIFEDNEWNGAAFNDTSENAFSWTADAIVPAGEIIRIDNINTDAMTASQGSVAHVAGRGTNAGIGNSNEVLYVYQGDAAAPTFITAIANSGFSDTTGVLTGTGLAAGVNALDLSPLGDGVDIAAFAGSRSDQASFADYAAIINNAANWIAQNASGDQSADSTDPDVPFSDAAFVVGGAPAPAADFGGVTILPMAESLQGSVETPVANESVEVVRAGGYVSGDGAGGAESIAFDPASARAFVTNGARDRIDILDLSNPSAPAKIGFLDLPGSLPGFNYGGVNAVAVKNGLVAVAVQNADGGENGAVALFNGVSGDFIKMIEVGVLPDHLTFSPDGALLIVGNEGQPFLDLTTGEVENAPGSVTIISIPANPADAAVRNTVEFSALDGFESELDALGIKTFDGGAVSVSAGALNATIDVADPSVSQDIEPEYIAVSPDGTRAFVTLQEVNAVAVIDLTNAGADRPVSLLPLGAVDFSLPGNLADFSDRDGPGNTPSISVGNAPIKGLLQPDAIASFEVGGSTYFITANEGDSRIVGSAIFDDPALNEARASAIADTVTSDFARSTLDTVWSTPTDLYAFGGRGFSIFKVESDGSIVKVKETGGDFDQIFAALPDAATVFNGQNGGSFDSRSDNKGGEPEGVAVGEVDGKMLAFIAMERIGGLMVWDVSVPEDAQFVRYIPPTADDYGPEVLTFVSAQDSPNGRALVLSANEVSGSVTVYEAGEAPPVSDTYTLQLLHLADAEAGLLASSTAKNVAAMVDAFEDEFENTLILSGGDNFIPGPFLSAGTDQSVIPTLNAVSGSTIGANATVPIGAVDTAILNAIGVEVSAIGNHEFDLGSRVFRDSFNPSSGWVGADYALVSANLDFSGDNDLASRFTQTMGDASVPTPEASTLKGRIAPAVVITEGGEKIGVVGATTQILEAIASPSGTEVAGFPTGPGANGEVDDMVLLAAQLQPIIDELRAEGVNKIILQSHLQNINNEKQLAQLLGGVDIILAAGSNTRLGDADDVAVAFPGHAANFADTYPLVMTDAEGGTTLIVNTDNEFTYLGRLKVDFDKDGKIIVDNLAADAPINGAYAATAENVARAWNVDVADLEATAFADGTKGDKVRDLTDAVQGVISAKDGNVFGFSDVYLEGERLFVRSQETNLGSLSADANAFAYRNASANEDEIVVSLKNGGGIRAQIGTLSAPDPVDGSVDKLPPLGNPDAGKPDGGVSQLDIENSLRFNNRLMAFETTPEGLKAILEHGVAAGVGQGRFPQIGGVSFSWDPDNAANARVSDIAVFDAAGDKIALFDDGVLVAGAPSKITVVTLNFLANGGDGYPMKENGENFRYLLDNGSLSETVDESLNFTSADVIATFTSEGVGLLGEQQAFGEFMQAFHASPDQAYDVADTPVEFDERIQNVNFREDTVLEGAGAPVEVVASALSGQIQTDQLFAVLTGADLNAGGGDPEEIVYTLSDLAVGALLVNGVFAEAGTQFTQADVNAGRVVLFAGAISPSGAGVNATDGFSYTVSNGVREAAGTFLATYEAFDFVGASEARNSGTGGDDYLAGGVDADFFNLRSGADTVDAGGGADSIRAKQFPVRAFAGDGDDQIVTGAGDDLVDGGAGNDRIDSGFGDDIIFGGAGNDQISSRGGDNLIFGGLGDDTIQTRRGDNVINAGLGDDDVSAGAGANVYILGGAPGENSDGDDTFSIRRDGVGDEFALFLKDAAGAAVGFGDDVVQGFRISQGDRLIAFGEQAGDWDDAGKLLAFAQSDAVRAFRTNGQDLQIVFEAGNANESLLTLAGFYSLNRGSLSAEELATGVGQELTDDVLAGILGTIVDDGQSAQTYLARAYGLGDMIV